VVGPSQSRETVVAALHAAGLSVVHRASHAAQSGKEGCPSAAAIGRESAFFAQRSFESEAADGLSSQEPGGDTSWLSQKIQALPSLVDDPAGWSLQRLS